MEFKEYLTILQIILLILTAFCLPLLNMWFENKLNKALENLEDKFTTKETTSNLEKKIDSLTNEFRGLNNWLRDNLNGRNK
jgi:hypothetical protein